MSRLLDGGFFPVARDAEAVAGRAGDVERIALEPGVHRPGFRQGGDVLRPLGEGQAVQIELIRTEGNQAGNGAADLGVVGPACRRSKNRKACLAHWCPKWRRWRSGCSSGR